jgi:tetratricopeptide (TPR) repeat protein
MTITLRGATAALVFMGASVAGAQAAPAAKAPACDPGASPSIAKATLFLQRAAQNLQAKQDASKDLSQAIGILTTPGKDTADAVGRAYYLGQAYILLLQQPGVSPVGTRSAYGIASNPTQTIDLFAAADSAFTRVETAQPGCAAELAQWRQQKPWLDVLNAAVNAVNAQKYDSATVYAKRALEIDRRAPYAYTVLASVASNSKDYATAASMLQKAIEAASADTLYNDARINAMYDLANAYSAQWEGAAAGAAKTTAGQQAVKAWEAFVPVGNNDVRVANAIRTAAQILTEQKDTTALPQTYAAVLANPAKFGDQTLLNAGVIAVNSHHAPDAVKLFNAVLDKNAYQRDALKNLAASYLSVNEPAKMLPLAERAVALDPNNADNWLLYAYAYSGMMKGTKDPKLTRAYTDSLVKYNTKSEKLTPRVEVREFSYGNADKTATLGGIIENRGTAAKSYTLQVEFLDRTGAVVGTQTATVGPVAPKASAPFKVTVQSPTAVAYRYKPLT